MGGGGTTAPPTTTAGVVSEPPLERQPVSQMTSIKGANIIAQRTLDLIVDMAAITIPLLN
jgi:hypothetical protein